MVFKKKLLPLSGSYTKMKGMIRSFDNDTDFFVIVIGVLQRDTLTQFLFIICLDDTLQMPLDLIKENDLIL